MYSFLIFSDMYQFACFFQDWSLYCNGICDGSLYDGFDELFFRFSCTGLATSFTSSYSFYINCFLFSYQIVRMFYQINSESFYLHQIQHMNTGTKCQHMRQIAVLQSLFGKPEKLVVRGFRLPLVPRESPRHGERLWFSDGPFLMLIMS